MPICASKSKKDLVRTLLFANENNCGLNHTKLFEPYLNFSAYAEPIKDTVSYCVRSSASLWRTEIVPNTRTCKAKGWTEEFLFFAYPSKALNITGLKPFCVKESISSKLAKRQVVSVGTSCTDKFWKMQFVFYAFQHNISSTINTTTANTTNTTANSSSLLQLQEEPLSEDPADSREESLVKEGRSHLDSAERDVFHKGKTEFCKPRSC